MGKQIIEKIAFELIAMHCLKKKIRAEVVLLSQDERIHLYSLLHN